MGKALLFGRLAIRDLRRHRSEAVLLFLVIAAASTTLTLGLVLHGETSNPYRQTRAATDGPDVVANLTPNFAANGSITSNADPAALRELEQAPGVTAHAGPYPTTIALLDVRGLTTSALLEGRNSSLASVGQPKLATGTWIRPGGVVVERSFATALNLHVGDRLKVNGNSYRVDGVAVDAAIPPYPFVCGIGCDDIYRATIARDARSQYQPGLMWVARHDVTRLATPDVGVSYLTNLRLSDPAHAPTFAASHSRTPSPGAVLVLTPWQQISFDAARLVRGPRTVLLVGGGLLVLLALASIAVLVGGRLSEQTRRVGLLKAVGATPSIVAGVLLVEHLAVTAIAATAGLGLGWVIAPLLTRPSAGLLGSAGTPPVTIATITVVVGVALAVSLLATLGPALQAARTSTIRALSDAARPPRRGATLIALSRRLPTPMLLGMRLAARRPRRVALGALSVAVTVAGIVAILIERLRLDRQLGATSHVVNPRDQRVAQAMLVITILLVVLAAINALLITWATIVDNRHAAALTRALGATPQQVSAGLSTTQLFSAVPGAIIGIPLGIALIQVVTKSSDAHKLAPIWWYPLIILATCLITTTLTIIPARVGANRAVIRTLEAGQN